MAVLSGCIFVLLLVTGAETGAPSSQANLDRTVRRIPITRTIRIPVIKLADSTEPSDAAKKTMKELAIWPGGNDEPPEGPTGFDIFEDGSLIVTDPLLRRLNLYSPQGNFRSAWNLEFAPDSVTVTKEGWINVRDAKTGQFHTLDHDGRPKADGIILPAPSRFSKILSSTSGIISTSPSGVNSPGSIAVSFVDEGSALMSLELLENDTPGGTFVALEASAPEIGGGGINLKKIIRRYSPSGALLAQSSDIPLDYYVLPVDELRVHKGIVYQLSTTSSEVRINEWDIN
jgi:hypothetical protein